jgi:hypothetical protein
MEYDSDMIVISGHPNIWMDNIWTPMNNGNLGKHFGAGKQENRKIN